jgi:hypothetical protein
MSGSAILPALAKIAGFEVGGCLNRSMLEQILRKIPDSLYEWICQLGENQVTLKEQRIALTSFARARKMRNVVGR